MPSANYKVREAGSGRFFTIRGTGNSRADAVAEASAKIAMTVGVIESASISDSMTEAELGAVASANGLFSDAILSLRNAAGKVVNVKLENVTTAIGTGTGGLINLQHALVTGFAAAYKDGNGAGGYTPYDGHFVGAFEQ